MFRRTLLDDHHASGFANVVPLYVRNKAVFSFNQSNMGTVVNFSYDQKKNRGGPLNRCEGRQGGGGDKRK